MMEVLITGATGLLGTSLMHALKNLYELVGTFNESRQFINNLKYKKLDITDRNQVRRVIEEERPQIVIHTAAITDVDFCEENNSFAKTVNIYGTKNIAEVCNKINAKMIFISSDFIFDGLKGNYTEDDTPNPINYYSKTKLEGEIITKNICSNYIIIRTSLYGWNPSEKLNFATWILGNLERKNPITVVTDQYTSLMLANDCCTAIDRLIYLNKTGTYNIASAGKTNRFNFAIKLAEIFDLDRELIKQIDSNELIKKSVQKAKRPRDVSLSVHKFERETGLKLPTIEEGLMNMKKLRDQGYLSLFKKRSV